MDPIVLYLFAGMVVILLIAVMISDVFIDVTCSWLYGIQFWIMERRHRRLRRCEMGWRGFFAIVGCEMHLHDTHSCRSLGCDDTCTYGVVPLFLPCLIVYLVVRLVLTALMYVTIESYFQIMEHTRS